MKLDHIARTEPGAASVAVNQFLLPAPERARRVYRSIVSQSELSSGLVAAGHPGKVQQYLTRSSTNQNRQFPNPSATIQ